MTVELEAALYASFGPLRRAQPELLQTSTAAPEIKISESVRRLEAMVPVRRGAIEMARSLFIKEPWGTVLEVLKHDGAHQYVHEIPGTDGRAVARAGRSASLRNGWAIDARARGFRRVRRPRPTPGASSTSKSSSAIAQLLALAQSSNVHEAQGRHQLGPEADAEIQRRISGPRARGWLRVPHLGRPLRVASAEASASCRSSSAAFLRGGHLVPVLSAAREKTRATCSKSRHAAEPGNGNLRSRLSHTLGRAPLGQSPSESNGIKGQTATSPHLPVRS